MHIYISNRLSFNIFSFYVLNVFKGNRDCKGVQEENFGVVGLLSR